MTHALRRDPLGNFSNRLPLLRAAERTLGALPFAFVIRSLQSRKLRKHLLVRLNDLDHARLLQSQGLLDEKVQLVGDFAALHGLS